MWFVRLGLAALILALLSLAPPPPDFTRKIDTRPIRLSGEPQHVETVDERVCLHTRVTDEVYERVIQRTFEMVREMGAGTIVEFLPWAYVEVEPGVYNWKHPDRIIDHAGHQGLRVIARMGYAPDWARSPVGVSFTDPDYFATMTDYFADYVGKFVERYQGRINTIIIWNEPNLNGEWVGSAADPQNYALMLRKAYEAAHAANPDIIVLGGALAPTNEPPHGASGWNDIDFLNEMYLAGAGNYMDALAVHVYGFTYPPQAEPAPDQLNFRRLELLREIMVRYGDKEKSIYITESGWNDHPRWTYAVRPGQRIAYTLDAYQYAAENWPYVKSICLWAFRFPAHTNSYPDYFTFVSQNFEPKPIYEALQAYARGWEQPTWSN